MCDRLFSLAFVCPREYLYTWGSPLLQGGSAAFSMMSQKVKGMTTCAYRLQLRNQCLWLDVSVEVLCLLEFPHPSVFNDGEDKLRCILPRRLVGSAVCTIFSVRSFRARMDNGRGIVVDCCIIFPHPCGFEECRAVERGVCRLRPNEADEVVHSSRFVLRYLKGERHHDLPDSFEVGVGQLPVNRLEVFNQIGGFRHDFLGFIVRRWRVFVVLGVKCRLWSLR